MAAKTYGNAVYYQIRPVNFPAFCLSPGTEFTPNLFDTADDGISIIGYLTGLVNGVQMFTINYNFGSYVGIEFTMDDTI